MQLTGVGGKKGVATPTARRLRGPSRRIQQAGSQGRGRTGVDASIGASITFLPPAKSEEGARGFSSPAENRLHTAFLAGQSELVIRSNTSHFLAARCDNALDPLMVQKGAKQ